MPVLFCRDDPISPQFGGNRTNGGGKEEHPGFAGCSGGRELITAVTAGIDIVCRMTLATRLSAGKSGWGLTAINGYFAAAASTIKILKLIGIF